MVRIVLVVVVLSVVAAVTAVAGHSQSRTGGQTLVLRVDLTKQALRTFSKGVEAGDVFVDRFSIEQNGSRAGHGHEACVVTYPVAKTHFQLQCDEFLSLRSGGTITGQGVVNLNFSEGGPQPATLAVTGGTGAYEGARGEISTKPSGHAELWTVDLLP